MSYVGRVLVAATFALTTLMPAAGSVAGPGDDLDKRRNRLEQVQNEIESLEGRAGSLEDEINGIEQVITDLQIEINHLDAEIAQIESEVRTQQAAIEVTQKQIDKLEAIATEQAVELYKSGGTQTFDALLDSRSLTQLEDRIELMGVASQQNTNKLVKFDRLQIQITAEKAALFKTKQRLSSVLADRSKSLAQRNKLRSELADKLATINGRIDAREDTERHLEDEIAAITGQIQELQAKRAVEALGESGQGFIWPLNGPVTSYYGPRWGRMHTGIDIDGYTGQPIVASKAGTVIMASSYSGYGNAVVIDHGGSVSTLYAHMSAFATSNGAAVEQGEVIGYVGCTGSCTGDHLHFEVRVNGSPTDPMQYLP